MEINPLTRAMWFSALPFFLFVAWATTCRGHPHPSAGDTEALWAILALNQCIGDHFFSNVNHLLCCSELCRFSSLAHPDAKAASNRQLTARRYSLGEYVTEKDYSAETAAAFLRSEGDGKDHVDDFPLVRSYTFRDVLDEADVWDYTFAVVVFSPKDNEFVVLYHRDHRWKNANKKLFAAVEKVTYMLRRLFPWRFHPGAPELVLAVGSGDYPHVKRDRLPRDGAAPVLMFGSAFRDPDVYANMVAMPLPHTRHLNCFVEFLEYKRVCQPFLAKVPGAEGAGDPRDYGYGGWLVFGEEYGLEWDNLIVSEIKHAFSY